jgi:hypothetical protein
MRAIEDMPMQEYPLCREVTISMQLFFDKKPAGMQADPEGGKYHFLGW